MYSKDEWNRREFVFLLSKARARCGNVHAEQKEICTFNDGLNGTIRSLIARCNEFGGSECTFEKILRYAHNEGDK